MAEYIYKRKVNYWGETTIARIIKPIIMGMLKTPITPNMITMFNLLVIIPLICVMSVLKNVPVVGILVLLCFFFDVMDGALARNKDMKTELGRKLDIITDFILYVPIYFVVGVIGCEVNIILVSASILIYLLYAVFATKYIVPKLRKKENFKHTKLKAFFESKGYIFGMDVSFENILLAIMFVCGVPQVFFVVASALWMLDLIYRLYELNVYNR